jgi:RND family efflux transporter MFP subunit
MWLARCCEQIEGIQDATLFLDGVEEPAARWPDPDDEDNEHVDVASATFAARRTTTRPLTKDENGDCRSGQLIGIPIELGSRNLAVVAVTSGPSALDIDALESTVGAAGRWLPALLASGGEAKGAGKHALLTRLMTTLLEPEDVAAAYLALVSELSTALACDRVSLGFLHDDEIRLEAVSHSARFDARTRLGRAIAAAMEESVDAETVVRWPGEAEKAPYRAHASLCQSHEMGCAFSVPLTAHGAPIGAICVEYRKRHPAGPVIAARMEQLATMLGPLVALRKDQAQPVSVRIWKGLKDSYKDWTSGQRRTQHVIAGVSILAMMLLTLIPGTHRIGSPARLEGLVQRAIVAPIEGYVAESRARAGDIIKKGAVLGAIDDTDLRLERGKWIARSAQFNKEYRAALAARDRSEANILRARLAQAQAELDLVEEQLSRTVLVAPFDGVVAEGDLSRSLGSPVERGEVLFQVAPLDRYRIVLEVDETEIDEIDAGQKGWLKLTAQPGGDLALVVERVVPVAVSEDGRNFFRVEAKLERPIDSLRPGMQGVGKIEVGRRSLLWIYTHSLFDWMRLRLWSWLP